MLQQRSGCGECSFGAILRPCGPLRHINSTPPHRGGRQTLCGRSSTLRRARSSLRGTRFLEENLPQQLLIDVGPLVQGLVEGLFIARIELVETGALLLRDLVTRGEEGGQSWGVMLYHIM